MAQDTLDEPLEQILDKFDENYNESHRDESRKLLRQVAQAFGLNDDSDRDWPFNRVLLENGYDQHIVVAATYDPEKVRVEVSLLLSVEQATELARLSSWLYSGASDDTSSWWFRRQGHRHSAHWFPDNSHYTSACGRVELGLREQWDHDVYGRRCKTCATLFNKKRAA